MKLRNCKPHGGVNISTILGLSVVVVLLTALLWIARVVTAEVELQDAVSAATTAVAADGCWDQTAQQAWGHALSAYPLSMVANQVTLQSNTTQSYVAYGHRVTVAARVPITPWGTARSTTTTGGLTLMAARQSLSLAPTVPSTQCLGAPTQHGWWQQWLHHGY
ncbi:MAG: hypothetical protein M0Z36_04245 [Thermaerobacter sp.]|nr:hypothetical protein [Thermaerobacter sp.]